MPRRGRTDYPGVYYIVGISKATGKPERTYYISYRLKGKRVEEKAGRANMDSMTAAKASRIRALRIEGKELPNTERRKLAEQIRLTKNIWTLDKLWDEFYFQKTEEGLKSIKIDSYRFYKYLASTFGKKNPSDISLQEIDKFKNRLSKTLKPATVMHVLTLLKRTINFGIERQLVKPLLFKIRMPKVNNQRTEVLTKKQLSDLLNVLSTYPNRRSADIMKLALFSGMRRGELFSLKWKNLDFENGFIYIENPKSGTDKKIPMNDPARKIIEAQTKTGSPYVFPSKSGNKLVDIRRSVNSIKKEAGLPDDFRPIHGLRHVYASMLASSGKVDLYTLQKLLTHKSPQMTQRYAHLRDDALKKAADLAGDIIEEALNSVKNKEQGEIF